MNMLQTVRNNVVPRSLLYLYRSVFPAPLQAVEIETTTICNRKCSYCPNSTVGRPERLMEDATFYRIIDSLKERDFSGRISPHFYGEPLTDSRLETFLQYVSTNLPRSFIKLFTNGDLLTVPRYLSLKQAGVDMFRIAQHSPQPSETIARTLAYIRDKHPDLYSVEYIDYFHDQSLKLNRGGLVNVKPRKIAHCTLVDQLTFDYSGNAVLCCNDYNSLQVFGNIKEKSAYQIWNDKYYSRMRNLIANGFWPYDICKICAGQQT